MENKWFDDESVKIAIGNAIVVLERWRRLRYGRKFHEVSLRNLSNGLVETLKQIISEDDEGKAIPQLITNEELAFSFLTAALLLIFPLLSEPQQNSLTRNISKGTIQKFIKENNNEHTSSTGSSGTEQATK